MNGLEQVLMIMQRIMEAEANPHPGCARCHGEPFVHRYDDAAGRSFSDRCNCPLGKWLAGKDRIAQRPRRFRAPTHRRIGSDGTEPSATADAPGGSL